MTTSTPVSARAPAATTVRFALLVAAVLATSGFIYISLYLSLPGRSADVLTTVDRCTAAMLSDPDYVEDPTLAELGAAEGVWRRWQVCAAPALLPQLVFVAGGVGVLAGLAGVLYLAQPWWMIRRRRLHRLTATDSPHLVGSLEQLRLEIGLRSAPIWQLAPTRATASGQAFGLPGRRQVQLDAGLALRHITDRPAFRAVVLHELAHLRNRDVDKTYLTVSIWRAFLAVAVLPFVLITLHPQLLSTPGQWSWQTSPLVVATDSTLYRLGSLLILTTLVILTRNAVLRVRELHADVTAAAVDGPDSALPAVLSRLPAHANRWRRWLGRWGTHPDPAQRVETVADPRRLFRLGQWELVGTGIAAGTFAGNLTLLIGLYLGLSVVLGMALVGLVVGALLSAMLAVSAWRTAARAPDGPPTVAELLTGPIVLVLGFSVGSLVSLQALIATDPLAELLRRPGSWLVATLLLCAGLIAVTAWVGSTMRSALAGAAPAWVGPAAVVAAAVAGATMISVWLPYSYSSYGYAIVAGAPATGSDVGWYAAVVAVVAASLGPIRFLVHHPLTLLALTLLWLVPMLARRRGRPAAPDRPPRRTALAVLLVSIGGALTVAVLPWLAAVAVPVELRRDPPPDATGTAFYVALNDAELLVGSLTVAAVMVVVAAGAGRFRAGRVALAATGSALLSAVAKTSAANPLACGINVWDLSPALTDCNFIPSAAYLSDCLHWILVPGLMLGAPFAVAAAWLSRRHAAPAARVSAPPPVLVGFAAAVLVIACAWLTWASLPEVALTWFTLRT